VLAVAAGGGAGRPVTAIRLDAFPDGGISRVRVIGRISPAARRRAGYRWLNSLPADQAVRCLTGAGLAPEVAAEVAGRRPLRGDDSGAVPPGAAAALTALLAGPAADPAG